MLNLDSHTQKQLVASVPARRYLAHPRPTSETAVAVSVFNSWLGPERSSELDCDDVEQARRNARHNALCSAMRERYEVFAVRLRGRGGSRRVVLRGFTSDADFHRYIDASDRSRTSNQFFVLAVPTLGIIYEQHWDDTNIAWVTHAEGAQQLRELAAISGLHVLTFAR